MPGPNDQDYEELEGDEETEETEETEESTEETEETEAPKGDSKRIADLTSARDKETARANQAEKALKALRGEGQAAGSNDPSAKMWMAELREASLDAVYGEYPELREFAIDRSLIEGSTRAEIREAASALVGLVKNVSTKARNKTLAEHGMKAESSGQSRKPPVDYGSMSDEDFLKVLDS
jgi:hypothetical protein